MLGHELRNPLAPIRNAAEVLHCVAAKIAVSGFGTNADIGRSQAAGFAHHLLKPVEPDALDKLIRRLLGLPTV